MKFEWDEDKNTINKEKHKISFETAAYVFDDPYYIKMFDFEHSVDEDRYIAIGKVGDIVFVVFTERKDTIRLISARLATNAERSLYYDQDIYYWEWAKAYTRTVERNWGSKKQSYYIWWRLRGIVTSYGESF